jgi:aldehyde dehydrogenase (NAD+)
MKDTSEKTIDKLLEQQRAFYASQQTKSLKFRVEQLKKFNQAIDKYEQKIADALKADLNKSFQEAYLTEISIVKQEISNHIKNIKRWAKPKRVPTPLHLIPSSGKIIFEPLGVSLIVAPWNYPFQLLMNPLVGSISAGNCAMLKPSPYTPNTAMVMEEMINETFNPSYISLVQGGRKTNTALFEKRFDIIFFTGSPNVGKVVMRAAAENLTPVILELGGKSPCIVDKEANIEIAAKRIAWGKTINAGQTCIAPDYVLVHSSVKEQLIKQIGKSIEKMFGSDPQKSMFYPRIVNEQAHERLTGYLKDAKIRFGGHTNKSDRYISPTIIDDVNANDPVMQDEIFGPILPIISFDSIDESIAFVNSREKPLAFYYFGKSARAKNVMHKTTSGGACINDTLMHITNNHLPFGGVGNSGLGKYHGKTSFQAFSNQRSTVSTPTWIDIPFKYVPFKYFKHIRRII